MNDIKNDAIYIEKANTEIEKAKTKQSPIDAGIFAGIGNNGNNNYVEYPFDIDYLSRMINLDVTHKAARNLMVSLVSGLGYKFNNVKEEDKKIMEKVKEFAESPNEIFSANLGTVVKNFVSDWLTYANAYLSLKKVDKDAQKFSLYNLNAITHRITPMEIGGRLLANMPNGIVQIHNGEIRGHSGHFYPMITDRNPIVENKAYGIFFSNGLSVRSDYYGEPEYYPALQVIEENLIWESFYIDYGNNNAQPSLIVSIIGEQWSDSVKSNIQNYFATNFKGLGNQNRTLILNFADENVKIEVERLSQNIDSSFLEKINNNDIKICRAWRVQPKLLGISQGVNSGGTENTGSMKEFIEDVVVPKQSEIEMLFNKILKKMFGINPKFKLNTPSVTSDKDKAIIDTMYLDKGITTVEEIRTIRNMNEFLKNPQKVLSEVLDDKTIKTTAEGEVRGRNLHTVPDDVTETDPEKNK